MKETKDADGNPIKAKGSLLAGDMIQKYMVDILDAAAILGTYNEKLIETCLDQAELRWDVMVQEQKIQLLDCLNTLYFFLPIFHVFHVSTAQFLRDG